MNYIKLALCALLTISQLIIKAQILGYGSGSANITWSSGTLYTDDIRSRVTNLTPSGSVYVLEYDNLNPNAGFIIGDRYLLIQMKGTDIGNHQLIFINRRLASNQFEVVPLFSQPMFTYNFSTGDHVQLVSCRNYKNFTLNGGEVTCHPWDPTDGTGGVCALLVSQVLTINDGIINVRGKGFTADLDAPGITWGSGSAGTTAMTGPSNKNAMLPAPSLACLDGVGTVSLNQGERGGDANTLPGLGSATTGTPIFYGGSTKFTLLVMGDPGYFNSGYGGGQGGAGGGFGGQGASSLSPCNNTGTAGLTGTNGGNGMGAGVGGSGGGVLVIKANSIIINDPSVVFNAGGGMGGYGGFGGDGGEGGIGGDGGMGCCDFGNPVPQGGIGGFGDAGAGGDGGDGGNGGSPGYIWIGTTSYSTAATSRSANFSVNGGKRGRGGWGGYGSYNTTPNMLIVKNECTDTYCASNPDCDNIYCDIDKAMCVITTQLDPLNINNYDDIMAMKYYLYNTSNNLIGELDYSVSPNEIKAYQPNGCGTDTYFAYCNGDCYDMIGVLRGFIIPFNLQVDLTSTTSTCGGPGYPAYINYFNTGATKLLATYDHNNSGTPASFSTQDNLVNCTFNTCFSLTPNGPVFGGVLPVGNMPISYPTMGTFGRDGTDGPNGSIDDNNTGSPDANVVIDDGGGWLVNPNTGTNILDTDIGLASIYPNPAHKELFVKIRATQKSGLKIIIKDVSGKEVLTFTKNKELGLNEYLLDISPLAAGIYTIELNSGSEKAVSKLVVK